MAATKIWNAKNTQVGGRNSAAEAGAVLAIGSPGEANPRGRPATRSRSVRSARNKIAGKRSSCSSAAPRRCHPENSVANALFYIASSRCVLAPSPRCVWGTASLFSSLGCRLSGAVQQAGEGQEHPVHAAEPGIDACGVHGYVRAGCNALCGCRW
jgi:hypothetical protein